MTRRKNGFAGLSSSDSSPELSNASKMVKNNEPPVTQAWLIAQFEKNSKEINLNIDTRISESENNIKKHLEGRIEILNEKINLLQAEKEQQAEKIEALEKMIKSKNIVISGPVLSREEVAAVINRSLASTGSAPANLVDVRTITAKNGSVKHIASCSTYDEKAKIMQAKKAMSHNGQKVYVDSDLTREEQEAQFEARKFAKLQDKGAKVAVGYKKVWVDNKCFIFDKSRKSYQPKN